jgi:hypothetical protein
MLLSRALSGKRETSLHSAPPPPRCGEGAASGPTDGAQRQAVSSVADPDPGSGAFLTLDPGSGEGFFRIPDLGSQTYIYESLMTNFWVKSISLHFYRYHRS